jgi:hypothetical protein
VQQQRPTVQLEPGLVAAHSARRTTREYDRPGHERSLPRREALRYPAPVKLRIRADTLRLRLTRSEIDRLCEQGRVAQAIHFGPGSALEYAIELADAERVHARYEPSTITIVLPRAAALAWAGGEEVGISAIQPLPEGELALLIEKDFHCLVPRGEQDDDAFPHPKAGSGEGC